MFRKNIFLGKNFRKIFRKIPEFRKFPGIFSGKFCGKSRKIFRNFRKIRKISKGFFGIKFLEIIFGHKKSAPFLAFSEKVPQKPGFWRPRARPKDIFPKGFPRKKTPIFKIFPCGASGRGLRRHPSVNAKKY